MVASVSILRGQIMNGSLEIKTRIAIYFNSGFLRPPKMFTEATAKATQYQGTCAINHWTVQRYPPMQPVRWWVQCTQFPFLYCFKISQSPI